MGTNFDEVIDLALVTVDDYKLTKLFKSDPVAFKKFCYGLLIKAIPNFIECKQSLDYTVDYSQPEPTGSFINNLTMHEKDILADYWELEWFTRETQNAAQIAAKLQNSGSFKSHSEAQNLKAKESFLNGLRVKVSQKCVDYLLQDLSYLDY